MNPGSGNPGSGDPVTDYASAHDPADFLVRWLRQDGLPASESATFQAYYAGFRRHFPERMRRYYAAQLDEAVAAVEARPGCRVLEIGCGCGTESLWLALRGADVFGVDVQRERVAVAEARAAILRRERPDLTARFAVTGILELPAAPAYDLIWMEQALHHLEPRDAVADHVAGMLKPGGLLVISEANAWNPLLQMQLFRRRGFRTVTTKRLEDGREVPYGDERVLTAGSLEALFRARGITPESRRYFRIFPNLPLFDGLGGFERWAGERRLVPLMTHFNWCGRRPA